MHTKVKYTPDYIFEASWEVCNKVGGIYTVLSTRANSLQKLYNDRILFVGPDVWDGQKNPWFIEDSTLFSEWRQEAQHHQHLAIRAGRWDVPGKPIVLLVKFDFLFARQNDIYAQMWEDFGLDSMDAYGDYHESTMFAYASGMVIESFYRFHHLHDKKVIAHFNEWQLGAGALYIKKNVPKIATIFTTHATSIGRSIAGNHLPLYDYLEHYNGDQMARELNMVSKHSIEKQAARHVDCLTTVSDITAQECTQFFHRHPDVVTVNGFEKDFIPKGETFAATRDRARQVLLRVAKETLGHAVHSDALLVGISGRYEYKNKGIDVFIDAMSRLRRMPRLAKDVIAFIMVPGWIKGAKTKIAGHDASQIGCPFTTHELVEPYNDSVMNHIRHIGFCNSEESRVKIIFVPSYLNGDDGVFNLPYYDLLIGFDASVFPSYYEPWGYTPHESVAFSIPTITTSLAGFGTWAEKESEPIYGLGSGVQVINRTDGNYHEVVDEIVSLLYDFSLKNAEQVEMFRKSASSLSDKADWEHFIIYYQEAYSKALHHSYLRLSKPH